MIGVSPSSPHFAQQAIIQKLATLDREVRNHEQAHAAVGGRYAGAPSYEYQRGPDGVYYAVAGEVSINTSPVNGNPQLTIDKAQIIRRAALAPAEPSSQDRLVAAKATQMERQARVELQVLQRQEESEVNDASAEVMAVKESDNKHTIESSESIDEATADALNQAQEQACHELSSDITAQLVAASRSNLTPKTLGSIVSQFF